MTTLVEPAVERLFDFGPPLKPSLGAISADVLGKTMLCMLVHKTAQSTDGVSLTCSAFWKQNRSGHDAVLTCGASDKSYRAEVKWSSIQLQTNTNASAEKQPNYYRWEFGNISPTGFDLLFLFGHHALQATAEQADYDTCRAGSAKHGLPVVWNPDADASADDWLKSCFVWIYRAEDFNTKRSTSLHCNAMPTRGPYVTASGSSAVKPATDLIWCADLAAVSKRLQSVLL